MKITIIFCSFLFLISCSQNSLHKTDNLSKPVMAVSPSDSNMEANTLVVNKKTEDVSNPSLVPPANFSTQETDIKQSVKKDAEWSAKLFGLSDLETLNLSKEDLEIRYYLFASLAMPIYKDSVVEKSVLVIKRSDSIWSAKMFRSIRKTRKGKSEVIEQIVLNLNEPISGWENFWQKLIGEEALNILNDENDMPGFDTWLYLIETKVNNQYRFSYFYSPRENSKVKQGRQVAKIFNLAAKEFNVSDLKSN